jgi:predicted transcriptional regulator
VVSAKPDDAIGAVEQLMATNQIRRIPVVDAANKPVGMISLNDLAIESTQPEKVVKTLAAICRHRTPAQQAA